MEAHDYWIWTYNHLRHCVLYSAPAVVRYLLVFVPLTSRLANMSLSQAHLTNFMILFQFSFDKLRAQDD